MLQAKLGRTGITVNKDGFGALPLQRRNMEEAGVILQKVLDGGINFIDTARNYTDSEEKIGTHIAQRRGEYTLATKTQSRTVEGFWADLETSLRTLRTDVIDIYQLHCVPQCYRPGDGTGMYEALREAKEQGKIRFMGITAHKLGVAEEIAESGLYDTLQYPFSYLSSEREQALVRRCAEKDIGFIAMKALSGGLLTNIGAARAFMAQYDNAVPIWGIQHEWELDALLAVMDTPGEMTPAYAAAVEKDRAELTGNFCRGCGYCLPCPADIEINQCARIGVMLRRAVAADWLTPAWQEKMEKTKDCLECGVCKTRCPYELDIPTLLKQNYADYQTFL